MRHRFALWWWLVLIAYPAFSLAAESAAPGASIEAYLQIKQAFDVHWLADGQAVVYLTNVTGENQIWMVDAAGGAPVQLTSFEDPVDALAPSPKDPHLVVFTKGEKGNERTQLYVLDVRTKQSRRLTGPDTVIFNFGAWSRDGKQLGYAANARDSRFFDAYVMTLETGESRLVMQQDLTLDPVTFSPSGRNLIVSARESGFDNNLYLVDLEKPKAKPVLLTPHNGWATYDPVLWPVGPKTAKGFWVVSNLAAEFTKLGFLTVEKRELAYQDRGLWDVEQLAFSRNGVTMAYTLNLHGFSRIVVTDVATGKLQPPPRLPEGVLLDLAVSPKGDRLAFTYTNSRTPADVYISDVATGEVKRLTTSDLAGVPPDTFVEPKWILYPSADEKAIPAFVYLPPEARDDRKAPGLVVLHGGPESQERPVFRPLYQYFVRRGYALILPNVRGSSGYGKTYLHLDDTTKRLDSVRDVADLVAFLQKQYPQIDAKRLGAWGGSYGGWLALACLTEYPNLFAAGASVVGITNFETFLEQTGPWRRTHREAEYGRLDTDREWLRRISPIHRADRVQAPLLLIHGKNDPRVPLGEAEQIAKALRDRNQPVELLVYEDEGHGLRKLKNRLDAYPKLAAFFDRYLRAPSGMHQQ